MDIRIATASTFAALLIASCGAGDEPAASETPAAETQSVEEPITESAGSEVESWCDRWWSDVVEAREDNPNSAVGAAVLLSQEGVAFDEQVIASRAEVLDYSSGDSPTADEIEQAIDDIELACAVYISTD